jgi:predicted enzyme related to lactoylglutathione lyase
MVYAKNFPRLKEFYGNMLRAQPVNTEWTDSWALFAAGEASLAVHAIPAEYAGETKTSSPPSARENAAVKLIFAVDDVPAERARLESMGIAMLPRPWQNPTEACDGIDPEGNVFQIVRAPGRAGKT